MHKKDMGKMGEALVIAQLLQHGTSVFTEFGDNSKVDLIVLDTSFKVHRVQVKMVAREPNTPQCSKLYLTKSGPGYRFSYTSDMFDWFALVDSETKKIAWVNSNILDEASSQISLRHGTPLNGQTAKIRYFDDYTECPFS